MISWDRLQISLPMSFKAQDFSRSIRLSRKSFILDCAIAGPPCGWGSGSRSCGPGCKLKQLLLVRAYATWQTLRKRIRVLGLPAIIVENGFDHQNEIRWSRSFLWADPLEVSESHKSLERHRPVHTRTYQCRHHHSEPLRGRSGWE